MIVTYLLQVGMLGFSWQLYCSYLASEYLLEWWHDLLVLQVELGLDFSKVVHMQELQQGGLVSFEKIGPAETSEVANKEINIWLEWYIYMYLP